MWFHVGREPFSGPFFEQGLTFIKVKIKRREYYSGSYPVLKSFKVKIDNRQELGAKLNLETLKLFWCFLVIFAPDSYRPLGTCGG